MTQVCDIIADFLKENKIKVVFGIIGSANSKIFDSIDKLGYTKIINTHHEQAAVMACGAYYRSSGKLSACLVTAGAGATNAITGAVSNWADSIPGMIISGNESSYYMKEHSKLRMRGTQGIDVCKMVKDVTKYSHLLLDENKIQDELEKCMIITSDDRKGPVWLDIPFDIQSKIVEKRKWNPIQKESKKIEDLSGVSEEIIKLINSSKRPLFLGGNGIRLSGSGEKFKNFINKTGVPTTLSWSAIDLLESNNLNFFGRFGIYGQRCANFIVQNCDLLVVFGSRLSLPQTGYNLDEFVREGKIVFIDIDDLQMPDKKVDLHVKENVSFVLDELLDKIRKINPVDGKWIDYCKDKRKKYPLIEDNHKSENYVNSYDFMNKLSCHLKDDHIIVTDMGTALLSGHQNLKLKSNQKMFTSLGLGEMGYGIAGSIGAAVACPDKEVLCLNCDGGIMMNLQELHTVVENGLNIKVVIFNNDGYLMIKHSQKLLFKGHHCSVDKKTGIGLPDFSKLLPAFGYEYFSLRDKDDIDQKIKIFLECNSNAVLEVFMDPVQLFSPKVTPQVKNDGLIIPAPIEDMSPLLNFQTLENDMIIKLSKNSLEIGR